jgi:hypothetical protein
MAVIVMLTSFTSGCIITAHNSTKHNIFHRERTLSPQTLHPFSRQKHGFSQIKLLCTKCRSTPCYSRHKDIPRFRDLEVQWCKTDRKEEMGRVPQAMRKFSPYEEREKAKKKMEESRTPIFVPWRPKKSCDPFKRFFWKKGP